MRRLEDAASAPARTRASAAAVMSRRELLPFFLFAAACYLVAPYLGIGSREVDPRIAEVWPPGGVGFVLLSTVWFSGRRMLAGTLAFMVVTFSTTAVLMLHDPDAAVWMGLLAVAQSVLMMLIYRRGLSHSGWVPQTPHDIAVLLYAAVTSSLLTGVLGGFPLLSTADAVSKVLIWWVLRNTVFCFVGAVTFMVIFYSRRTEVLSPSPWYNRVGLLCVSVICVYGTYLDPTLPLSWLLMIPSVWGGLTLTTRGTAYLSLTVALSAALMTYLPQNQFGYTGVLPASSIVDLLVIASTAFAFLLTLMRDQRARLITELDRRAEESESQRQLLETVFESMNDGVMVVDDTGVSKYNAAARQLLGRPIPIGRPHSWSSAYSVTTTDGRPLGDDDLRAAFAVSEANPNARTGLEVVVGQGAGVKVLDVSAKTLGHELDRKTRLLLLHDVTAQRARLRELTNFAGMVAHDLRGPLTVLEGWLEVLEDAAVLGESADPETLAKARDASRRMGRVIEDWLGYTVVQNGQARPEATKLADAVEAIIEGRRDGGDAEFAVDVSHAVDADPALLRQLLDNLVGNAVKYTPLGEVPKIAITSYRDLEPGWVRVEVTDQGMGIPEGEEELIFEEFHRGPTEGRSAGTGLGLALTRRIVALHGGQLAARRNPEGGSTFSFTLQEA